MTRKETSSPRDRLLDTAAKLFQQYGFRAVGIDRILAESGVAKMTLYRHFGSKDELIAACLERADEQFWSWAESAMEDASTPEAKLRALFDAVEELASSPECLGCMFQGAAMAFSDLEHPGRQVAVRHKVAMRDRLADLGRQAELRHPDELAAKLALLIDGAWVAARVFREGENPASQVSAAAQAVIEGHRRGPPDDTAEVG